MADSIGEEIGDQILHVVQTVVGLVPIPIVAGVNPVWWAFLLAGIASAFWFSFWREDAQHRKKEGWRWMSPVEFRGTHKGEIVYIGGWKRWLDIGCATLIGGPIVGGIMVWQF